LRLSKIMYLIEFEFCFY